MNKNIRNQSNRNQNKHRINNEIRSTEVRLVGFYNEPILINTKEAIELAITEEKDLVIINDTQTPPIAKIIDYKKFLYENKKLEKEKKKNSFKPSLKEIKLSPEIAENDLLVKSRKAIEFLKKGDHVKCSLILKGRQKSRPERGQISMLRFAVLLEDHGSLESIPILQGNKWNMMVKPKKK
jgi:translation initiation factor IF-3